MIARLVLAGIAVALAIALPDTTQATSLNEVKKLTASDAQFLDRFGRSVAISGDTAVVGADLEDAGGSEAGAAYIFQRDQGSQGNWGEVTKLTASDAQADDRFGVSVAVSGDTAVVGAPNESAEGTRTRPGAVYIFQRNEGGAGNWGEVRKLTASDAEVGDLFGRAVSLSGDTAIVSTFFATAEGFCCEGAAYVFQRDQGGPDNWGQVKKLTSSGPQAPDGFGDSVAVSGDTAVVGAPSDLAGGRGAGAAYVFRRDLGGPDNWGEVARLTASNAQAFDTFGFSVTVSGDTAIVGAPAPLTGNDGAAYVFRRDAGSPDNWGQVKKLTATDADGPGWFGFNVAVSEDTAVVGAAFISNAGTDADPPYVFQRDQGGAGNWGEISRLTASDAAAGDLFGESVAVSGDTAVVGATGEGVAPFHGAAYVFDLLQPKPTPTGDANCDGTVNAVDAALILQFSADLIDSLACQDAADVNGDLEVTSVDAALILQFVAGLVGSLAQ